MLHMFLLRTAFWLTVVLMILPIDRDDAGIASGPGTFETLAAVQTVVADMRRFCERNPQACDTGSQSIEVLRQKAVYSAGVVQGWLSQTDNGGVVHVNDQTDTQPLPTDGIGASADQVAALIQAADGGTPNPAHPPL